VAATGDWRTSRDVGLHNLHSSPNIITITKPKKMRWARHVAGMNRRKYLDKFY
jgi:hypothetical protein